MTPIDFQQILAIGREQSGVEFKQGGSLDDKRLLARVVRAILAMSNRRDGGTVVIGAEEAGDTIRPIGLSLEDVATWKHDHLADKVAVYSDPYANFETERVDWSGKQFIVIHVRGFSEIPVLCRKTYTDGPTMVLRDGALYVRSGRKPESIEVPSHSDLREIIELSVDKALTRFIRRARSAGMSVGGEEAAQQFKRQLGDLA